MVSSAVVAQILEHSLVNPPRRVYRWLPTGYTEVPDMVEIKTHGNARLKGVSPDLGATLGHHELQDA